MPPLDITIALDEAVALLWDCGPQFRGETPARQVATLLLCAADLQMALMKAQLDIGFDVTYYTNGRGVNVCSVVVELFGAGAPL